MWASVLCSARTVTSVLQHRYGCNLHTFASIKYLIKILSPRYIIPRVIKNKNNSAHTHTYMRTVQWTHNLCAASLTIKCGCNREPCVVSSCILHLRAHLPRSPSGPARPDETARVALHLVTSRWPVTAACLHAGRIFRETGTEREREKERGGGRGRRSDVRSKSRCV